VAAATPAPTDAKAADAKPADTKTAAKADEKPADTKAERERLGKELTKLEKEKENSDRQLANESFLAKAPGSVIEGIRRRNAELTTLIERTRGALGNLPPE